MDNIYSYEASDSEEIELHPAPKSCTSNEDRTQNWTDITVAGEIRRGLKLREKKPSSYRRKDRVPLTVKLPQTRNARKRHKRKSHDSLNMPCPGCSHWIRTPYLKSFKTSKTRPQDTRIKCRIKAEKNRKCTMRTAELAVPTKRHCIDTWRNKSYVLPELMIERLKQHVLDLRPVVQIPEALYCFRKRRRRRLHKKSAKNDSIYKWKPQIQQPPCVCVETKTLCLLFAQKIVQRLSTPLQLSINSEFERLSRVVDSDITKITNCMKSINGEYQQKYSSIHSDVINRVTLWILGILEDLASKQLREQLRDLEEEEGPVLDFLDDLVDNVLNICIPLPFIDYNQEERSNESINSGSLTSEYEDDKLTDSEHFRNEISNIINNLQENEQLFDFPEANDYILSDKEHFRNEIDNLLKNFAKEVSNDEYKLSNEDEIENTKYFKSEIINIISIVCKESKDEINKDNDELKQIQIVENSLNQKGSVEMLSEDTDDRSKKVMFSISDMVNPHGTKRPSEFTSTPKLQEEQDNVNYHNIHTKHNILFGKPNAYLLSDADELWPNDTFSAAVLRPSASVTKSITSLGKFSEDDENNMLQSSDSSINSMTSHEVTKSTPVKLLQNDKKQLAAIELHANVTEKLNLLNVDLPDDEVTKLLEANQTLLSPKEANDVLADNTTVTAEKSIDQKLPSLTSLLKIIQLDTKLYSSEIAEKLALLSKELQGGNIVESVEAQKLKGLIMAYLSDKRDTEIQTDKVKIPKEVVLGATGTIVTSFDSRPQKVMDKRITGNDKHEVKICKNKRICTERENNAKVDRDWKVELETAPSWFIQTNAHGEPSDDSMPAQANLKLTQSEIHKWCRDLDIGFNNLDIWRDWLQNTSTEAAVLLKKKKECTCSTSKYTKMWKKLKSNVTKDAVLWDKINQHTHETFECYQKYKTRIKIVPSKRKAKCVCINTPRFNS